MKTKIAHAGLCRFFLDNDHEIIFDHGERACVYDTEGNSYIDFVLGFGPVILGHAHPDFQKVLTSYLQFGIHLPGYTHWHEKYLDRLLGDQSDFYSASFFKTASEAVSAALRLSAIATGKMGVIRCGYIGWHDALIGKSVYWHEPPGSPLRNQLRHEFGFRGIGPEEPVFNWINFDLNELENLLLHKGNQIGAFVIDAYQLSFTDLSIIRQAISLCHEFNLVIIFDETKTGGRISKLGLAINEGLDADLIILGKSLANGAPLSLLIGKENLFSYAEQARICGTFSKELLGIYSALATLEIMEKASGFDVISKTGQHITQIFNSAAQKVGVLDLVRAEPVFNGGIFDIRFSQELISNLSIRRLLLSCLAEHNILLLQGHPSFVCLDHGSLNWDYYQCQLIKGLSKWASLNNMS